MNAWGGDFAPLPRVPVGSGLDGHSARLGRHYGRDQNIYDWQHYIASVGRKPRALRNGAPFREVPEPLVELQRRSSTSRGRPGHGTGAVSVEALS